jgi:FliI/YscN family ATPase
MRDLIDLLEREGNPDGVQAIGRVTSCRGPIITAQLPQASIGEACTLKLSSGENILAEIVGFNGEEATLAPLDNITGVGPGTEVIAHGKPLSINLPKNLLGSVIDPLGNPLKIQNNSESTFSLPLKQSPPSPLQRKRITQRMDTGVSAIDCFCPIGRGQRLALMASAGVGKSTLMGMIARHASVDVIVVGLIGERGREVNEFIEDCLGEEGLKKSVLVVATSDESPNRRRLAAYTATAVAEHFRAQGKDVLLLMDSMTRFARAVREVGLAAGEIPVRHGYPPSLYIELPKLLERSGCDSKGAITAIYTVLTDNERELDPLAEEVKSILDGHLCLSRKLGERGIRPSLDVPVSVSRLVSQIEKDKEQKIIQEARRILSRIYQDKDIMMLGGTPDRELSAFLKFEEELHELISQNPSHKRDCTEQRNSLEDILARIRYNLAAT